MRFLLIAVAVGLAWCASSSAETVTRAETHEVETSLYSGHHVAFTADGTRAAVLGYSDSGLHHPEVEVYETAKWRRVAQLPLQASHSEYLTGGLAFSADGQLLAAGAGPVSVWRTDDWQQVYTAAGPFARGDYAAHDLNALAFSGDSHTLAALYDRVWFPESLRVDTVDELVNAEAALRNAVLANSPRSQFTVPLIEFHDASTGRSLGHLCPGGCDSSSRAMVSKVLIASPGGVGFAVGYSEPNGSPGLGRPPISVILGLVTGREAMEAVSLPNKSPVTAAAASGGSIAVGSMPNDIFGGGKDEQPVILFRTNGERMGSVRAYGAVRCVGLTAKADRLLVFSTAPYRDAALEEWDVGSMARTPPVKAAFRSPG